MDLIIKIQPIIGEVASRSLFVARMQTKMCINKCVIIINAYVLCI